MDHICDRTVGSRDTFSNKGEEGDPDDVPGGHVPVESTETPAVEPQEEESEPSDQNADFLREPIIPLVLLPTPVVVEDIESSTLRNCQVPARFQQ